MKYFFFLLVALSIIFTSADAQNPDVTKIKTVKKNDIQVADLTKKDTIPKLQSQDTDKTVIITVTGQGKTIDEARQNALSSAIEQTYAAFISSSKTILNNKLVKDEILTVSNGYIQKYEVLDETKLPDGTLATSLKAIISISMLKNIVDSKGLKLEFQGGLFALKIKQQILSENAEVKAIWNTLFMLNPILNQSFDYKISANNPKALDNNNKEFAVPILVEVNTNSNIEFVFNYLKKILNQLSLNSQDKASYTNLNKEIFPLKIDSNIYLFRKKESISAIIEFIDDIKNIMLNFYIDDGMKIITGRDCLFNSKCDYGNYSKSKPDNYAKLTGSNWNYILRSIHGAEYNYGFEGGVSEDYSGFENKIILEDKWHVKAITSFDFEGIRDNPAYSSRKGNEKLRTYQIDAEYDLLNLDKIKNFKVFSNFPKNKIGSWLNGGRVFYIDAHSNYFICPIILEDGINNLNVIKRTYSNDGFEEKYSKVFYDLKTDTIIGSGYDNTINIKKAIISFNTPEKICNSLTINGYNDWFLPSKIEMEKLILFSQKYYSNSILNWRDYITSSHVYEKYNAVSFDKFISIEPSYNEQYYVGFNLGHPNLFAIDEYVRFVPIRKEKIE